MSKSLRLAIAALVLAEPCAAVVGAAPLEYGPLAHEFRLTLEPGDRGEWLGPLFSSETTEDGWRRLAILPPLFVHERNSALEHDRYDIGYPLLTYFHYGPEYRWQLGQLFAFSGGHTPGEEEIKQRLTLFPFLFHQRSSNPSNSYTAVLPFYGTMRNHLFRDEINFVLMPLYVQTRKGGMITDNYLAPLFHRRHGAGYDGWQFWPIAAHESKAITYRTNNLDELEVVPGHRKSSALWLIWNRQRMGLGTPNPEDITGLFPFFILQRSPLRDQTQYLFPVFTYIDDREKQYREWSVPWPLVDFARGEGKTGNRVWPLFSQVHTPSAFSEFYAWPIWLRRGFHGESYERERSRILFFLWSDTIERNLAAKTERRRRDLLPFFTHRRDYNGNERLQILAPLEPFLPGNRGVERGLSPLWSLYRAEKNAQAGTRSQSLLWNLWRRDATTNSTRTSFLFGAVKTEKTAEGRRWGMFRLARKPAESTTKQPAAPAQTQSPKPEAAKNVEVRNSSMPAVKDRRLGPKS